MEKKSPPQQNKQTRQEGTTTLRVLNSFADEGQLSSKTQLPVDFGGEGLSTTKGYKYIPFFAPTDDLFRFLLEVRLLSPTQAGCISDKTFYSLGSGLEVKDQPFPPAFDKKINSDRETIDDICKVAFDSFYQDGNAFIEIVRTQVADKKYVQCYIHNNMDCRLETPPEGSRRPTHVIRSREFRKTGIHSWTDQKEIVRIPLWTEDPLATYDPWVKTKGGVERTMIHLKNRVNGVDFYGLPTNYSGLLNAILEYKDSRFNCDNFDNNMFIPGVLFVQGNLSEKEEKNLLQKTRSTHIGENKQQRVIVVSSEAGVSDTKFVPLQEKQEGHFITFDQHQEEKIIGANDWSRALRDMKQTGGLGNGGDYVKNLFKMKFVSVIRPAQSIVLNNFVFPLMKIIDEFTGTKYYDLPWTFKPVTPASLDGMLDLNAVLTVDEGREELGREKLPDAEKGGLLIVEAKEKAKGDYAPKTQPAGGGEE
jgi:hypothetical protein